MSIKCALNDKLEALQAQKDKLAAKLDSVAGAGASALADMKAEAEAMKDKLLDALPEIEVPPNFKQELSRLKELSGEALTNAKAAFKERWGDALPDVDIDEMMAGATNPLAGITEGISNAVEGVQDAVGDIQEDITNSISGLTDSIKEKFSFDLCKDAPNVDAPEVDPDTGKVTKVIVKAPEPVQPTENAVKVETVTPTIADASVAPSKSDRTELPSAEIKAAYDTYTDESYVIAIEYAEVVDDNINKVNKVKKSRAYKRMRKKYLKTDIGTTIVDFYNTVASSDEKAILKESWAAESLYNKANTEYKAFKSITNVYTARAGSDDPTKSEAATQEYLTSDRRQTYKYEYKVYVINGSVAAEENKSIDVITVHDKVYSLYQKHKQAILDYNEYND